jgi:hypothetical protein
MAQAYNEERPYQGRWCYGKTPMQTLLRSIPLGKQGYCCRMSGGFNITDDEDLTNDLSDQVLPLQ